MLDKDPPSIYSHSEKRPRSPSKSLVNKFTYLSYSVESVFEHVYVPTLLEELSALIPITIFAAAAAAKSLQSCPTLCDPIDGSPPGSTVPGILQARTLEWVAISVSNA